MPAVFLTIDTEFAWRHHAAGLPVDEIHARSVEPAGVGLTAQLETLTRDRKSTRLNSSHVSESRMPSSA